MMTLLVAYLVVAAWFVFVDWLGCRMCGYEYNFSGALFALGWPVSAASCVIMYGVATKELNELRSQNNFMKSGNG